MKVRELVEAPLRMKAHDPKVAVWSLLAGAIAECR